MKDYIKVNDTQHIEVSVYYSKGGMNYWTYKNEPRGYYLSVTPVVRRIGNGFVSTEYQCFSGTKVLLNEVSRKSKSAYNKALESYKGELGRLMEHVISKNKIEVTEEIIVH